MKCEFIILNEIERDRQLLEERLQLHPQPVITRQNKPKKYNKKKSNIVKAKNK